MSESRSSLSAATPGPTVGRIIKLATLLIAGWFLFWPGDTPAPLSGPHDLVLIASGIVERLSFSPDSRRLLVGMPQRAVIWDAESADQIKGFRDYDYSGFEIATFSPDGRSIVTKPTNTALLFDAATGAQLAAFAGHTRALRSAAFSADGRRLITTSLDETVRIWDAEKLQPPASWLPSVETRGPLVTLVRHRNLEHAAFSPDGKRALVLARVGGIAELLDAETWRSIAVFRAEREDMRQAIFTPDSRRVLTLSSSRVQIWSAENGRPLVQLAAADFPPWYRRAAVSPDSRRVAIIGANARVALWDAESGRVLAAFATRDWLVNDVAFSPDGRRIATTSSDGAIGLFDAETGSALITLAGAGGRASHPTFSPDGRRFAATLSKAGTFSGNIVKIWPLRDDAPYHDPSLVTAVRRESPVLDEWIVARYRLARRRLGFDRE